MAAPQRTPLDVVRGLEDYIQARIGVIAEEDWLFRDDFEAACQAVRRQWALAQQASPLANLDVKRELQRRCERSVIRAHAAFGKIITAWLSRKE